MKYINLFEEIELEPQVGDYVICVEFDTGLSTKWEKFNYFLSNNIGRIVFIDVLMNDYYITFDNPPEDILDYAFYTKKSKYIKDIDKDKYEMVNDEYTNVAAMDRENIIYWSKNKKKIEVKLTANKYNL